MDRVSSPSAFDWARMAADMQTAYLVTPWVVAARYCETVAANLSGRTETPEGVPIGRLFHPNELRKLLTAWSFDAVGAMSLQSGLQKTRPEKIELYRRELVDAAKKFDELGFTADPRSFHETPPPAPNSGLRIVSERAGRQEATLSFESGYRPKPELPGSDDYLAMKKLHSVEARMLRHTDQRDRPWIVFLHGFGMGNANDLDIAGAKKLHEEGFNVVTLPYPFHGNRRIGMPGEGALGLDIMTMLNAQSQGLWDVRRVIGWIRENHPDQKIGAYGASMGGFALGMLVGLESLDCGIGVIPAFDIVGAFEASVREKLGAEYAPLARKVLAPLDMTSFSPQVPSNKLGVVAAIADGITTPDQAVKMQQHFGGSIDWVVAGHLTAFREAQAKISGLFEQHLLDGAPLAPKKRRRLL
jgi:hypothetical protein